MAAPKGSRRYTYPPPLFAAVTLPSGNTCSQSNYSRIERYGLQTASSADTDFWSVVRRTEFSTSDSPC